MNDEQLLRYSRHILLPEIDVEGQQRLLDAHAVVVGLGGLGSPAAIYLATAGAGRLTLIDFDRVELSNLQRQIVHGSADIGRPKVDSAREHLLALNPEIEVRVQDCRAQGEAIADLIDGADVVLDCSDNFETRFALNEACVRRRVPLVSGAAIRFEGQVSVFHPGQESSPCYRCLYRDDGMPADTCTQSGVAAPLLGIIGSVQALEALKLITGAGRPLTGRLLLLDALSMEWRSVRISRDPNCPVCSAEAAA